jgi:hypothetical protein
MRPLFTGIGADIKSVTNDTNWRAGLILLMPHEFIRNVTSLQFACLRSANYA